MSEKILMGQVTLLRAVASRLTMLQQTAVVGLQRGGATSSVKLMDDVSMTHQFRGRWMKLFVTRCSNLPYIGCKTTTTCKKARELHTEAQLIHLTHLHILNILI